MEKKFWEKNLENDQRRYSIDNIHWANMYYRFFKKI